MSARPRSAESTGDIASRGRGQPVCSGSAFEVGDDVKPKFRRPLSWTACRRDWPFSESCGFGYVLAAIAGRFTIAENRSGSQGSLRRKKIPHDHVDNDQQRSRSGSLLGIARNEPELRGRYSISHVARRASYSARSDRLQASGTRCSTSGMRRRDLFGTMTTREIQSSMETTSSTSALIVDSWKHPPSSTSNPETFPRTAVAMLILSIKQTPEVIQGKFGNSGRPDL